VVGADGPTHAGAYDISFMRSIPNMVIACPSDENECRLLLNTAYEFKGPAAVRYPRGKANGTEVSCTNETLAIGKGRIIKTGKQVAILCFGPLLHHAVQAAEKYDATVVDMRFVKPLDEQLLGSLCNDHSSFITVEDHAIMGGAGSTVSEWLNAQGLQKNIISLGIPDAYVQHGTQEEQWHEMGIDTSGIEKALVGILKT